MPLEERQERGETFVARNRGPVHSSDQSVGEREPVPVAARAPGGRGRHGILPEFHYSLQKW